MTVTTDSEVRSQINGHVPQVDSPAVHARARARMTDTKRDVKTSKAKAPRQVPSLENWWVWTSAPASYSGTWAASNVDRSRIPANNTALFVLWQVSNWTDRLIMFALILLAPTALTGPLRWAVTKPTRRYALYLIVVALAATYLIGVN